VNQIMKERLELIWQVSGMAAAAGVFVLIIFFVIIPKKLNRYYLRGDGSNGMAACVYADFERVPDTRCYCSNNPGQAIEELQKLNEGIK